jgi:hypothetical protein
MGWKLGKFRVWVLLKAGHTISDIKNLGEDEGLRIQYQLSLNLDPFLLELFRRLDSKSLLVGC